jgi:hypothetical protein
MERECLMMKWGEGNRVSSRGGYVSVEGGDDNKKSDNLSPEG